MTLDQRVADIKVILAKLDHGWRTKSIFCSEEVDYMYPYHDGPDDGYELNPGYRTLVLILADLLGLTEFGVEKETDTHVRNSIRNYHDYYCSQQEVWNLMEIARDFVNLIEAPVG